MINNQEIHSARKSFSQSRIARLLTDIFPKWGRPADKLTPVSKVPRKPLRHMGFMLEPLEPRLLLSADLTYANLVSAPDPTFDSVAAYVAGGISTNYTLRVVDDGGLAWKLYATGTDLLPLGETEVLSHAITVAGDLDVNLKRDDNGLTNIGGLGLSLSDLVGDKIKVDTDSLGLLNGHFDGVAIDIDFAGGKDLDIGHFFGVLLPSPLDVMNDQLRLNDDSNNFSGTLAHSLKIHSSSDIVNDISGIQITSSSDIEIKSDNAVTISAGSILTAANITLSADASSTGGLIGGLFANASSAVTLNNASLIAAGGTVSLLAHSDVTFTEDGDSFFNNGLSGTAVLSFADAAVNLQGVAVINAANAILDANIHTNITATANDPTATVVAVVVTVFNSPEVNIGVGADIDLTGNFTAQAISNITIDNNIKPKAGDNANDSADSDAAIATTILHTDPTLTLSGGDIDVGGVALLKAENTILSTTIADGALGAAGATVAFSLFLGDTSVVISGGTLDASTITVQATSDRTATTTAKATAGGSDDGAASGDSESEKRLANPDNDITTNDKASTDEGDITFAAAVAVGVLTGDTTASITGGSVHASAGDLTLTASGKVTVTTTADGSSKTDGGDTGVGAAVAISVATPNVISLLGGIANVGGANVNVNAFVPDSKVEASATSGSGGASSLGVAGSLALNVAVIDAYARLDGNVQANGANINLNAQSTTTVNATAKATVDSGGDATGVGASVAINIADNDTHAELVNGAILTGANNVNDLSLSAESTHTMNTEAKGGTTGGTSITPVVAVSIATYNTKAVLGTGGTLTVAGAFSADAEHTGSVNTLADGEAAGSTAAVGVAIAFTYAKDTVVATTMRSLVAGGAVTFTAASVGRNSSVAKASASGGEDEDDDTSGQDAQQKGDSKRSAGNSRAANSGSGASGSGTDKPAKAETSGGGTEGEGEGISVAAAIAVNIVDSEARAEIAGGVSVSAGGLLTVRSGSNVNGDAVADGSAASDGGSASVGAAVSVNSVDVKNTARVSGNVTAADGMVVEALMLDRKVELQIETIQIVDDGDDTIFLGAEHGLTSGQKVKYHHGTGGADIGGLTDGDEYYVFDAGGGKIKLYDTNADDAKAGGATGLVDLDGTGGTGDKHYFGTYVDVPIVGEIENPLDSSKVNFDPDLNEMRVLTLGENNGLRTGDEVVYHKGGAGATVGGLTDGHTYYVIVLDDTHAQLAASREDALDGLAIALTSDDVSNDDFLTERTHSIFASATSGAGGGDVGVAGSVAINRAAVVTLAEVVGNVTLADSTLGADGNTTIGALKVRAHSTTDNTANALPDGNGAVAESVGVGASFALNLNFNDTTAQINNGADISGSAASATVEAIGTHRTTTEAKNGAKGGTGIGAAVAVVISEADTKAYVGTSGTTLNTTGDIAVSSQHTNILDTKVSSEAAGDDAAVGASVGVNYAGDTNNAQIARNMHSTGGAVSLTALLDFTSALDVHASAGGGDSGDSDDADAEADQKTNNNSNTGGGKQMESAGSNTDSANSESTTQSGVSGEGGDGGGGGGVGVAAAIAINIARLTNTATVTDGADLTGTGAVTLSAQASIDSKAQADGMSVNLSDSAGTVISAAVALNFANVTNTATVGDGSTITGNGVTIEAVTTADERNDFVATAFAVSAADSDSPAIAGVFALNVIDVETKAQALDGSDIESTGGVTVTAEHDMGLQALAASVALSTEGTTVGGAIIVNIVGTGTGGSNTVASIGTPDGDSTGATVNADGAVSVPARHGLCEP